MFRWTRRAAAVRSQLPCSVGHVRRVSTRTGAPGEPAHGYVSLTSIGGQTILTFVLIHTFGMLIGQDIWQRVFTARSDRVASWGGTVAGVHCLV